MNATVKSAETIAPPRGFMECGGKRSATPLSRGEHGCAPPLRKRRRRCALLAQSKARAVAPFAADPQPLT